VNKCPNRCSAAAPQINLQDPDYLPAHVKKELENQGLSKSIVYRCGYCGYLWIDVDTEYRLEIKPDAQGNETVKKVYGK
jgi:hypothetical protein